MTPEQLVALPRVQSVAAAPDGTWLAVAAQRLDEDKQKYVTDLWRVPTDGGEALQLTSGKHNDTSPAFRHDGALLFLSDRPTAEDEEGKRMQLWAFRPEGGDPVALTDEPLGVQAFVVARDADVFVVRTSVLPEVEDEKQRETAKERGEKGPTAIRYTEMPVRFWDHWLPDNETHFAVYRKGERRPWFGAAEYREADFAISHDGTTLAVVSRGEVADDRMLDSILELWDVETLEGVATFAREKSWFGGLVFGESELYVGESTRDGKESPKPRLLRWDLEADEPEICIEALGHLSVVDVAPDGMLVAVGDHEGHTPVFSLDPKSGERTRITAKEAGGSHAGVSAFTLDGATHIAGVRSTLLDAPATFTVPFEADSTPKTPAAIGDWERPGDLRVEEFWAESTDGEKVHYFMVGPDDDEERPVLLWIHGGPISSWGDIWHWRWNSLIPVARGYRVVLSNPRGSTGYGRDFVNGIWGNVWGAQCYEDLMAVTDEVEARPDVDADRIVAMGGSFGGYMTNWIGGMTDRFACLVSHAGIASFATFHGITDSPMWWSAMLGINPFEDQPSLDLYSPISKIADWKSPTLVIHGQQDYRVPVGEALLLFEGLQRYGVESQLLIYPDENHWILRPRNIVSWYDEFLRFCDEQLS